MFRGLVVRAMIEIDTGGLPAIHSSVWLPTEGTLSWLASAPSGKLERGGLRRNCSCSGQGYFSCMPISYRGMEAADPIRYRALWLLAPCQPHGHGSLQKRSLGPLMCRHQRERTPVVRRSQSSRWNIFGCLKDPIPDLFRCFHFRINRINHAHEDALIGFGVLLDDPQNTSRVVLAG
jgi:hypothetical protein